MKIGQAIHNFNDAVSPGLGLVGLLFAPATGGASLMLTLKAVGLTELAAYGIDHLEEKFSKK